MMCMSSRQTAYEQAVPSKIAYFHRIVGFLKGGCKLGQMRYGCSIGADCECKMRNMLHHFQQNYSWWGVLSSPCVRANWVAPRSLDLVRLVLSPAADFPSCSCIIRLDLECLVNVVIAGLRYSDTAWNRHLQQGHIHSIF